MIGDMRVVGNQVTIDQERSQDGEASQRPVDQHRVLADPAQACQSGEVAFQQGRCVGEGPAVDSRALLAQPGQQLLELVPEDPMIIEPAGVPCDLSMDRAG